MRSWKMNVAALAVLSVVGIQAAFGAGRMLVADDDPEQVNSFTVTFPPELGGATQTAEIPHTVFVLNVDEDAGTARLVTWFQLVNPFDLLGFSTGDIKVILGGPSSGTYDAATGIFTTNENYNVFFDDTELAAFGFTSPFLVPGSATGTITPDDETMETGTISMSWGGTGIVETPDTSLLFTYSCAVNARFDATTVVIQAVNDPALENAFTVTFPPELGGQTQTADIPSTEFVLQLDPNAGTGRLLSWSQAVEPFDILGFSTGDITVGLGGESVGTYDSTNGIFATNEIYDVFFDDTELSSLGFTSPFSIPSSSGGAVTFETDTQGTVAMNWSGEGELTNPNDPEQPYIFTYSCAVNAAFGVPCSGDANGDGLVDPLDSGHVLSRFGCAVGTGDSACDAADVNVDGRVDPLDAGFVLSRFGSCK